MCTSLFEQEKNISVNLIESHLHSIKLILLLYDMKFLYALHTVVNTVFNRGWQSFQHCKPVKNENFFADRLSKKQMFGNEDVSLLQWGTASNSNVRCKLMNDIIIYLVTVKKLNSSNASCKLILLHHKMLHIYSKVFNLESIRFGNELSTNRHQSADRWVPTAGLYNATVFCYRLEIKLCIIV